MFIFSAFITVANHGNFCLTCKCGISCLKGEVRKVQLDETIATDPEPF